MQPSIKKFVEVCSKYLPIQEPIYEFGSKQPKGQEGFADLRPFFKGYNYVGTDMENGLGVDEIQNLHEINLPDKSVGMCISCNTFEHVEYPRKAVSELYRVLKPGGFLIISSHMNFRIHAAPDDYWRFTPDGFRSLLKSFESVYVDWNGKEKNPHTVVGIARKGAYSFENISNQREEWRSITDVPLSETIFEFIVKCKKYIDKSPYDPI
jgi:SAM-dependent methyltransferase